MTFHMTILHVTTRRAAFRQQIQRDEDAYIVKYWAYIQPATYKRAIFMRYSNVRVSLFLLYKISFHSQYFASLFSGFSSFLLRRPPGKMPCYSAGDDLPIRITYIVDFLFFLFSLNIWYNIIISEMMLCSHTYHGNGVSNLLHILIYIIRHIAKRHFRALRDIPSQGPAAKMQDTVLAILFLHICLFCTTPWYHIYLLHTPMQKQRLIKPFRPLHGHRWDQGGHLSGRRAVICSLLHTRMPR